MTLKLSGSHEWRVSEKPRRGSVLLLRKPLEMTRKPLRTQDASLAIQGQRLRRLSSPAHFNLHVILLIHRVMHDVIPRTGKHHLYVRVPVGMSIAASCHSWKLPAYALRIGNTYAHPCSFMRDIVFLQRWVETLLRPGAVGWWWRWGAVESDDHCCYYCYGSCYYSPF